MDGRIFLAGSPLRSTYFKIVTVIAASIVIIDGYILVRYWRSLPLPVVSGLAVLIGSQTIYQWWRALYYYRRMRQLHATETPKGENSEPTEQTALSVAAAGLTDMLFYSFAMILILMILTAGFLAHLPAPAAAQESLLPLSVAAAAAIFAFTR